MIVSSSVENGLLREDIAEVFTRGYHRQNEFVFVDSAVYDLNAFRRKRARNNFVDIFVTIQSESRRAERFRKLDEIGGVVDIRGRVMPVIEQRLPLSDHAERMVIEYKYGYVETEFRRGNDFVEIHVETAVAGEEHGLFSAAHACADSRAHTVSHGSQSAARDHRAGFFEIISLSYPHLMLSDVGCNYFIGIAETVHCLNYAARAEFSVASEQKVFVTAFATFRDPFFVVLFVDSGEHGFDGKLCVSHNRNVCGNVFAEFRKIDIDVYFLCLIAAFLYAAPASAQKEYPIDHITAINMGDGRILHRDLRTEKPLNGNHRIIDGYHSAYIQADFKDGLYNGKYAEYEYNKLK